MEAVDVLLGGDSLQDLAAVNLGGEGQLHENSVNAVSRIEIVDKLDEFSGRRLRRRSYRFAIDTHLAAGFDLVANVDFRGGVVSD